MSREAKIKMMKHARVASGLFSILKDDIELIRMDAEEYNLISMKESINEAKDTLRRLVDTVVELEYTLYLAEDETRK